MTSSSRGADTATSIAPGGRERLGGSALGTVTAGAEPSGSIGITNYNYAAFVDAAINSALVQQDADVEVEVIVVDDGSTDDSLTVIERFADRITTIATPNNGQAAAFNRGFAASRGAVVIFLDAD